MAVRVLPAASRRIDEIYRYTRERWGAEQAARYVEGLFEAFGRAEAGTMVAKRIPSALGVDGYLFRHGRHVVYWRRLPNGDISIVTVLHERMHPIDHLRDDLGS